MRPLKFRAFYSPDIENNKSGSLVYGFSNEHNEGYALGIYLQDQLVLGGVTIMQFTGLFDKNGDEIWENDTVATDANSPGTVVWYKGAWRVHFKGLRTPSQMSARSWTGLRVTGNKYGL